MKNFFPICNGFGGQISSIIQKHQDLGEKKPSDPGNISIYKSMSYLAAIWQKIVKISTLRNLYNIFRAKFHSKHENDPQDGKKIIGNVSSETQIPLFLANSCKYEHNLS